jgi:hypothetical protein
MKFQPTPTATSSVVAGMGLWAIVWACLLKLDAVAKLCRVDGFVRSDKLLDTLTEHKVLTLLGTETVNLAKSGFGMDAMGVMFALGGTLTNITLIVFVLPVRKAWRKVRGTWTL